jgi:hypothetical protein
MVDILQNYQCVKPGRSLDWHHVCVSTKTPGLSDINAFSTMTKLSQIPDLCLFDIDTVRSNSYAAKLRLVNMAAMMYSGYQRSPPRLKARRTLNAKIAIKIHTGQYPSIL